MFKKIYTKLTVNGNIVRVYFNKLYINGGQLWTKDVIILREIIQ